MTRAGRRGINYSQCCPNALPETSKALGPPDVTDGIVESIHPLCTEYTPV